MPRLFGVFTKTGHKVDYCWKDQGGSLVRDSLSFSELEELKTKGSYMNMNTVKPRVVTEVYVKFDNHYTGYTELGNIQFRNKERIAFK